MTLTIFGPESEEMKTLTDAISYLLRHIRSVTDPTRKIFKFIKDNNAIIAGGALTNSLLPDPIAIKDIDIYVNVKDAQKLLNSFLSDYTIMKTYRIENHTAPVYDKSFMWRNNILARIVFVNIATFMPHIEIMIVKDNFPLEKVVDNFDLTFCKVWTDGEKIYTRYINDIKNLTGELDTDYFKAYLEGNTFTARRLEKYMKKGFTIKYPNINTSDVKLKKYKKKLAISEEEWVVYFILKNLVSFVNKQMIQNDFYISFEAYVFEELTAANPDKVYNLEGMKKIIRDVYQPYFNENFTINTAIYGLIMYDNIKEYLYICEWYDKKVLKYFEKIGIKLVSDADGPSHGFNNEPWNFCTGNDELLETLERVPIYNLYRLFENEYQDLDIAEEPPEPEEPLTEEQQQEQMRAAEKRFAQRQEQLRAAASFPELNEGDEVEEAEGMYETLGGTDCPLTFQVDIIERPGYNIQTPPPTEFTTGEEAADFILHWIENDPGENIIETRVFFGNGEEAPGYIRRQFINVFAHVNQPLETLLTPVIEEGCKQYQENKEMFQTNADNRKMLWLDIYLEFYPFTIRVNFYD